MSRFAALCDAYRAMSPAERRAAAIDGLRYLAEAYDHDGDDLVLEHWLQQMVIAIVCADLARDRKQRHYSVQVSAELHALLKAESVRRGISMARLVDEAITASVPKAPA